MGSYLAIFGVEPWRKAEVTSAAHRIGVKSLSRCRHRLQSPSDPKQRVKLRRHPNRFIKTEILHRREADVALESKVLVKRLCI
jgi:hypothetical protein